MQNVFRDLVGFAGDAADRVFLGGAIGRRNDRNEFTRFLGAGDTDAALQFAIRKGDINAATIAQNQGALAGQRAAAAQKRQQDQAAILGRVAQFGDSLAPEQRLAYAQSIAPILQSQFDLDDEDVAAIMQAAQVPQGFGALASAFIDPNQQIQNSFEDRRITETGRSNRASEGLRGAEIDVSRGNLALGRDRLAEDRRQFDTTQETRAATQRGSQDLAARNLSSREQRTKLITDTIERAKKQSGSFNTGAVAGLGVNPFAQNLRATLDTIQANIGFEELQRLRDNSPTGGALGQVTERELEFLQSVLGSLAQTQSAQQLDRNLDRVQREILASWDRVRDAYEQDFGEPAPVQGGQNAPTRISGDADYNALPSGAEFIAPDGTRRRKP